MANLFQMQGQIKIAPRPRDPDLVKELAVQATRERRLVFADQEAIWVSCFEGPCDADARRRIDTGVAG